MFDASARALERTAADIDRAYGPACDAHEIMDVPKGLGTLAEIEEFAASALVRLDG